VVGLAWLSVRPNGSDATTKSHPESPDGRRRQSERRSLGFLVLASAVGATGLHFLVVYGFIATGPALTSGVTLTYPVVLVEGQVSAWATLFSIVSLAVGVMITIGAVLAGAEKTRCPQCDHLWAMEVCEREPLDTFSRTTYRDVTDSDGKTKHITTVSNYQNVRQWRRCKDCDYRESPTAREESLGSHSTES
jgi:hypothetical protein